MIPRVDTVVDLPCHTGENPLWHADEARLYWTDIPAGRLYGYSPETGAYACVYEGRPVGGFTIESDGSLLLFRDRGNIVRRASGQLETVIREIPELASTRFNDVIADPRGRVFAGTMSCGAGGNGRLYRLDPGGILHCVSEGYGTPNGMGFTPDRRRLYFTDSRNCRIYLFDYDEETGGIENRRLLIETPEDEFQRVGKSDGMTVDREGMLWSARWDGGHVLRLDPEGRIRLEVPMPARKITSVAFGGPNLADLYATSAGGHERSPDDPLAGSLFRLSPGVEGVPEFGSRIVSGSA